MKPTLALIITKQGVLQNGLLALLTTIPQINAVLLAEDADAGLRILKDHQPRLVLLDMDLPKEGPQTILGRIQAQHLTARSIAIADNSHQKQSAESLKADAVLFKGFQATKLINVIESLFATPLMATHKENENE